MEINPAGEMQIDPEAYLRLVLENIADDPISRIADLLPWNLAAKLQPVCS